ncbi:MAG: transcription termination/antitermination protein NusA [Elusimicrobia bacterium]|nr:transcription termination/antitermination protein NusA [Elusimicrobiota bacterium]
MAQQTQKSELILALEQIEREKGVKKEDVLKMIEGALISALRKHMGKNSQIEATVDPDTAQIKAHLVKKIVETVTIPDTEISLAQAKQVKPKAELDQEIQIPIDTDEFSRIAAQTAKQVLVQKMREIERDNLYEEFKPKEGEVITGSIHRYLERNLIVDLGKAEAILPLREQIRKERYNPGDRVRAIILKVDKAQRGPQILLSRAAPLFLKRLLETEVPEVNEKIVEILEIVRDPGFRAKVLLRSNNPKVDPLGACVGIRGSRIRTIMNELSGERIDLIPYHEDVQKLIANAFSPAKVTSVKILDKENKRAEVIVPDTELSMAIGREGQNIRLASRLLGWEFSTKSEGQKTQETKQTQEAIAEDLTQIPGVGQKTAEVLVKAGVSDIEKLAKTNPETLSTLQGIGEKTAEKIIQGAQKYLEGKKTEIKK